MTQSPTTTTDNTAMSRQRIAELRVQCQTEPRSIEVHQQAIEEFLSAGLSGEALPLLRRLVALTPDDIHSVALFARVLAERGQHRDAVAQFTKLTE
ncbi:MAG TPA: BTAD domain-containing putative transcriptional regulator, partial [candidate division Zixibacteria bacterium]|nr:BTAD domain-containing putative transcriptional regulator [candidate division Zixibacteria bacterium]